MIFPYLAALMFIENQGSLPMEAIVVQTNDDRPSGKRAQLAVRWFSVSKSGSVKLTRRNIVRPISGLAKRIPAQIYGPSIELAANGRHALISFGWYNRDGAGTSESATYLQIDGQAPQLVQRRIPGRERYSHRLDGSTRFDGSLKFSPCSQFLLHESTDPVSHQRDGRRVELLRLVDGNVRTTNVWRGVRTLWTPEGGLALVPIAHLDRHITEGPRVSVYDPVRARLGPLQDSALDPLLAINRAERTFYALARRGGALPPPTEPSPPTWSDVMNPSYSQTWRQVLGFADYGKFYETVMPVYMTLNQAVLLDREGPDLTVNYPAFLSESVSTCFAVRDRYFGFLVDPKPEITGYKTAEHFWYRVPGFLNHRITHQLHLYDIERRRMHAVTLKNAVEQGFELDPSVATAIQFVPNPTPSTPPRPN